MQDIWQTLQRRWSRIRTLLVIVTLQIPEKYTSAYIWPSFSHSSVRCIRSPHTHSSDYVTDNNCTFFTQNTNNVVSIIRQNNSKINLLCRMLCCDGLYYSISYNKQKCIVHLNTCKFDGNMYTLEHAQSANEVINL